jgi:cytosine/adenosine deaminase-related metal-dependent hydrolase
VSAEIYAARAKDVAARMIGGEMMVMSGRDSSLFSLNATASVLWQAIDGRTPLSRIVAATLCREFDVDEREALRDAEEILRDLAGHGVVVVSDAPIAEASR